MPNLRTKFLTVPLGAEVGERHDAFIARTVDPDRAVLRVHFGSDVPQPVFIFAKHLGDASDGVSTVNLVDGQDQAAAAIAVVGAQFHGNNSSTR